jgi:hypothetical protein
MRKAAGLHSLREGGKMRFGGRHMEGMMQFRFACVGFAPTQQLPGTWEVALGNCLTRFL